ncbi:putative short-chain dehydrogenase [Hyaloscypha variabilis F]|uniref:Putative short-chain dehydrogenase n=1 Tax=Hyaloscypha variabilis (strain UAMH 11265 / GT02V1 / F) TaxID=1149755 RepID=A0A2J6QZH2_HYAVF|nr:putative short-chain dehydrogenase [Hyaloscypha variabilis F]
MTSTSHPVFNENTESLDVAEAFAARIHEKTILITGVNLGGIGFATAKAFASQSPSHLIIAGRNPSRLQESIDALKAHFPSVDYRALKLDLSSQKAVREAAAEVLSWNDVPTIDIIMNNAAVMNIPELTLTEDGLETQFATNHIGHFLFTCLVMPKLVKAAQSSAKGDTRIINVTSLSPTMASMRWSDINYEKINKTLPVEEQPDYATHKRWGAIDPENKSYLPLEGYNQGKVANVLFGIGINKRLYDKFGILSLAVHPGIIRTELSRYASSETREAIEEFFKKGLIQAKTLGAGAATSLVAATDPALGLPVVTKDGKENYGAYLIDCQISDNARASSVSSSEAEKLWALSETLVKERFAW